MADLTLLRSRVYERDKHDAGWGAANTVSVAYVLGHTCAVDTRGNQTGSAQTEARTVRRDNRHGVGNGNGNSGGYGYGDGGGNGDGYGDGGGNGDGDGGGNGDGFTGQPWQI